MSETATPTRTKAVRAVSAEPLPPSLEGLVPPAVAERSRAFADAQAKAAEARAAVRAAREGVDGARAADQGAAVEAAAAGKAAPKPTAPKAEERLADAERALVAHREVVARAGVAYVTAVREALPVLIEKADAELATVGEGTAAHIAALEAALVRSRELKHFRRALDLDSLSGREPSFVPGNKARRARSPLTAGTRELLDALRAELGQEAEAGR
ncbi:MAG TPA: hypothetical protein VFK14_12470 [Solirubrobacterales bacterium]|nr:hypothetical protein [Solirubrobacterales bacterium]